MQVDWIKQFSGENCGVSEDKFPLAGKCCTPRDTMFWGNQVSQCAYCRISTSHPYGAGLNTVTIFECTRLGYGRRVK